jgi:hypothetical protein
MTPRTINLIAPTDNTVIVKVVINDTHYGASLSSEGANAINKIKSLSEGDEYWVDPIMGYFEFPRHDLDLIKVIEDLGKNASRRSSELKIVEINTPLYIIDGIPMMGKGIFQRPRPFFKCRSNS